MKNWIIAVGWLTAFADVSHTAVDAQSISPETMERPATKALAAESFDLSRVHLLDSPFKELQELHRKGLVGQLEPDKLLFGFRKTAGFLSPLA